MWKNYGMTFIEYIFLDRFRKSSSHMLIKDQNFIKVLKIKTLNFYRSFANFELMSLNYKKQYSISYNL